MKPILIFRHIACEGPGYLAEYLQGRGIPWRLVAIDAGEPVPKTVDEAGALVFMGGPMSVNDNLAWIADELSLIRQADERGMAVLGHCLGGQLIAKALGAHVYPNAVREIGWHEVSQCAAESPWLTGLPARFEAFHWHGETFDLPPGAIHLLRSASCHHQAFARGSMLALQCHVEMTEAMIKEWAELYREQLVESCGGVQSYDVITTALATRVARLNAIAERLYDAWLERMMLD